MAVKVVIFTALVCMAAAEILPAPYAAPVVTKYAAPVYSAPVVAKYAAPVYSAPVVSKYSAAPVYGKHAVPEPYDPHPHYAFNYNIHDEHTGDVKSQQEERDGDVVKGAYSFIESDGSRRVVEYTSDPEHGFNAVVRREPGVAHPTGPAAAAPAVAPAYHKVVAPVYHKVAAPVYHAPVAKVAAYPAYATKGYYH